MFSSLLRSILGLCVVVTTFACLFTNNLAALTWEWQNPLPQGNPLFNVWGSSGSDMFVVGDFGTILHSSNPDDVLFEDGFETGDTSRWSATVP